jgi:hypothetical protein
MIAMGHITSLQQQPWCESELITWIDTMVADQTTIFTQHRDSASYDILQSHFFIPLTSDTGTPFPPSTSSMIDRYSEHVATEYITGLGKMKTTMKASTSLLASTPTSSTLKFINAESSSFKFPLLMKPQIRDQIEIDEYMNNKRKLETDEEQNAKNNKAFNLI